MSSAFSVQKISDDFSRAAAIYDDYATLQQHVLRVASQLLLPHMKPDALLVDLGCGTGRACEMLRSHQPTMHYTGIDISPAMAKKTLSYNGAALCANAEALPFNTAYADAALSSLMLQWANNRNRVFEELARVLKPGCVAVITVFGEHTLNELSAAFSAMDNIKRVSDFPTMKMLLNEAKRAGLSCEYQSSKTYTHYYETLAQLMASLKAIGATSKLRHGKKGLTKASVFSAAEANYRHSCGHAGLLPATWQVHYLVLRK